MAAGGPAVDTGVHIKLGGAVWPRGPDMVIGDLVTI